jgi:hypothetical protein
MRGPAGITIRKRAVLKAPPLLKRGEIQMNKSNSNPQSDASTNLTRPEVFVDIDEAAEQLAQYLKMDGELLVRLCDTLNLTPHTGVPTRPAAPLLPASLSISAFGAAFTDADILQHQANAQRACLVGLNRALDALLDDTRLPDAARSKALHYYVYGLRNVAVAAGLAKRGPGRPVTTGARANRLYRSLFGAGHGGRRAGAGRKPRLKASAAPIKNINDAIAKTATSPQASDIRPSMLNGIKSNN